MSTMLVIAKMKDKINLFITLSIINFILLIILLGAVGYLLTRPTQAEELNSWKTWVVQEDNNLRDDYDKEVKRMRDYVNSESQANRDYVNKAVKNYYSR